MTTAVADKERLERLRSGLSPAKRALLERALAGRGGVTETSEPPPRRPDPASAPLSFSQERLWFLDQLSPGTWAYNIPAGVRLEGRLDLAALDAALERIVERHEVLRTRFVERDGTPEQRIDPPAWTGGPVVDLSALDPQRTERVAQELAGREARRPFDLARGPLLRPVFVRLGPRSHAALLTLHHIVADGWSVGVLVRELAELYRARLAGAPSRLAALPLQFGDHAFEQRHRLEGERLECDLNHWRERLDGAPPSLRLPTDRPRPAVQGYRGASRSRPVPPRLVAAAASLAERRRATPFMVHLGVFELLLHRWSGQDDLTVGTPVAGRDRPELEGLIGFFANTLVLRLGLDEGDDFDRLLERVRDRTLDAFSHQDVPFERLVEELQPERRTDQSPLFQVMFVYDNSMTDRLELPAVELARIDDDARHGAADFDLTLTLDQAPDGSLSVAADYDVDLFDDTTILRLLGRYLALLDRVTTAPDQPLTAVPMLLAGERQAVLREWNDSQRQLPGPATALELIEATWSASPSRVAVRHRGESCTYGELERRSRRWARRLTDAGVGPGDRLAVSLPRSVELVVAFVAAWRVGAAYVPLDPAYPADRWSAMLGDARCRAVLCTPGGPFADEIGGDLPIIDPAAADASEPMGEELGSVGAPALPAYLVYTSGSTGRPKAVVVDQGALGHHCRVIAERYELGRTDRVLQFVSPSFDVAAQEIFPTLAAGATLVLRPREVALGIDELVALVEDESLSVLNLPTSYWHEWVAEIDAGCATVPGSVRVLVIGTEQARGERWRQWIEAVGDRVRLVNGYGPTEATIESSAYEPPAISTVDVVGAGVPIGRPLPNTRSLVVNARGVPVPPGVPGELVVSGVGLAHGYFDRPALTAERFVPDGHGPRSGGRCYRTGDLARFRPDGTLEHLGRTDSQVKVRGFRVEPEEIEAVLIEHPAVREAAVVPVESGLAAFYVATGRTDRTGDTGDPGSEVDEIRRHAAGRLPAYMVPQYWRPLPELPLSPNGKVNRRRLAATPIETRASGSSSAPPSGAIERTIAEVWGDVLRLDSVGRDESFFDLGGHSLLMVRVKGRLEAALERPVTMLTLFQFPTVAALARELDRAAEDEARPSAADQVDRRSDRLDQGKQRLRQRLRRRARS